MKRAFIFPGQGSQAVGMGKALAEAFPQAKAVFDEVDDALSQKLSALMWEGPAEDLTLTANTQPALMAVSLAAIRVLEAEGGSRPEAPRGLRGRPLPWRIFGSGGRR
jgi:[acyl-carrier-protein] S-malonyltransferase